MSKRTVLQSLISVVAFGGAAVGCSSEAPLDEMARNNSSAAAAPEEVGVADVDQATARASEVAIDEIALYNGGRITISEVQDGPVSVVISLPEQAFGEVESLLQEVRSLEHLYSVFAPERQMPEAVSAVVARLANVSEVERVAETSPEKSIDSSVDATLVQTKEAPRDVQGFINGVCKADQVAEASIDGVYARRPVACQTERTGNASTTVTESKQLIAGIRPYRGSIDQKWHWKNGAVWTLGGTVTLNEGQSVIQWVFNPGVNDLKIETANATGDGYNRSIETADANPVNQKSLAGNDYYQQECECVKAGQLPIYLKTEGCANNQFVFDNNMTTTCQSYQQNTAYGQLLTAYGYLCGQTRGQWERITWGNNCAVNFDIRECTHDVNCRYKCTDTCVKL